MFLHICKQTNYYWVIQPKLQNFVETELKSKLILVQVFMKFIRSVFTVHILHKLFENSNYAWGVLGRPLSFGSSNLTTFFSPASWLVMGSRLPTCCNQPPLGLG